MSKPVFTLSWWGVDEINWIHFRVRVWILPERPSIFYSINTLTRSNLLVPDAPDWHHYVRLTIYNCGCSQETRCYSEGTKSTVVSSCNYIGLQQQSGCIRRTLYLWCKSPSALSNLMMMNMSTLFWWCMKDGTSCMYMIVKILKMTDVWIFFHAVRLIYTPWSKVCGHLLIPKSWVLVWSWSHWCYNSLHSSGKTFH